jgi:hypothetical protein
MMGMRSLLKEMVFVVAVQGEPPLPDEAPDAVDAPEPVPAFVPLPACEPDEVPVPPEFEPLSVEEPVPPPGVVVLLEQPNPMEIEAMVAKERNVDVARRMKTVLSTSS